MNTGSMTYAEFHRLISTSDGGDISAQDPKAVDCFFNDDVDKNHDATLRELLQTGVVEIPMGGKVYTVRLSVEVRTA